MRSRGVIASLFPYWYYNYAFRLVFKSNQVHIQQLATVVSVVVNRKLNVSIYDKITQLRNLPYMPELPNR